MRVVRRPARPLTRLRGLAASGPARSPFDAARVGSTESRIGDDPSAFTVDQMDVDVVQAERQGRTDTGRDLACLAGAGWTRERESKLRRGAILGRQPTVCR